MNKTIWISWETHRRTSELAKAFNAKLFTLLIDEGSVLRYPVLSINTLWLLLRHRPSILFVQNPSIVLAAIAAIVKPLLGYKLIVDRHSNFKMHTYGSSALKWKIFHALSRFSIRRADLTILTNQALCEQVLRWGGKGVVLPDKVPDLPVVQKKVLDGDFNIVCVSTYSSDEPIFEILGAARLVGDSVRVYVTGSYHRFERRDELQKKCPENVCLTGFLSESGYLELLASADAVMVLTTEENLLTCGAYEALAYGKAMILSNTHAITEYFSAGAVYTEPVADEIASAILECRARHSELVREAAHLRKSLDESWRALYRSIVDEL